MRLRLLVPVSVLMVFFIPISSAAGVSGFVGRPYEEAVMYCDFDRYAGSDWYGVAPDQTVMESTRTRLDARGITYTTITRKYHRVEFASSGAVPDRVLYSGSAVVRLRHDGETLIGGSITEIGRAQTLDGRPLGRRTSLARIDPDGYLTPLVDRGVCRVPPEAQRALLVWVGEPMAETMQDLADRFTANSGVPVVLEIIGEDLSNPEGLFERLVGAAELERGPDVFVGEHENAGRYAAAGLIDPLDLGSRTDEFHPISVDAFLYAGDHWGLPFAQRAIAMFYNADLTATVPKAFEDLGATCATMTGIENCVGLQFEDPYHHYPFISAFGGYVFGFDPASGYDSSDIGLDAVGAIEGAEFLASQTDVLGFTGGFDETVDLFFGGVQPYLIGGPWLLPDLLESDLTWGVVPIPMMGGNEPHPFVGVTGFYQGAYGRQSADVAFLFDYVATTDTMVSLFESTPGYPPAHLATYEVVADDAIEAIMSAVAAGEPVPNLPEMGEAWGYMQEAFDAIRLGTLPAEDAMRAAADALRAALGY